MDLHHIGIATRNVEATATHFGTILESELRHAEHFAGIEVRFLECDGTYLELLEPSDGGPIASFLEDRGPGIHHLALETPEIHVALDRARAAGVELIDDEPRPGAWGHEVAFLHPSSTGGVLFEFVAT